MRKGEGRKVEQWGRGRGGGKEGRGEAFDVFNCSCEKRKTCYSRQKRMHHCMGGRNLVQASCQRKVSKISYNFGYVFASADGS